MNVNADVFFVVMKSKRNILTAEDGNESSNLIIMDVLIYVCNILGREFCNLGGLKTKESFLFGRIIRTYPIVLSDFIVDN